MLLDWQQYNLVEYHTAILAIKHIWESSNNQPAISPDA